MMVPPRRRRDRECCRFECTTFVVGTKGSSPHADTLIRVTAMALPHRERFDISRAGPAAKQHISPAARAGAELFVAVVHSTDGVRFAEVADSRPQLVLRLADYVRRRAVPQLSAHHARHVRGLLARGELEAAVEVYFHLVGERWDEEWLVTAAFARDAHGDAGAALDSVAWTPETMVRSREA
jgi:hypothetical protein